MFFLKKIKFVCETFNILPNGIFETNVTDFLNLVDNNCWNITVD